MCTHILYTSLWKVESDSPPRGHSALLLMNRIRQKWRHVTRSQKTSQPPEALCQRIQSGGSYLVCREDTQAAPRADRPTWQAPRPPALTARRQGGLGANPPAQARLQMPAALADNLHRTSWATLSQNRPARTLLDSRPTAFVWANVYCFKPFAFGVLCSTDVDR